MEGSWSLGEESGITRIQYCSDDYVDDTEKDDDDDDDDDDDGGGVDGDSDGDGDLDSNRNACVDNNTNTKNSTLVSPNHPFPSVSPVPGCGQRCRPRS